jgi:hypothetical protein
VIFSLILYHPVNFVENPDQVQNMGISGLNNNYMKYRIGLSRELLLRSKQTMALTSVFSPPLEFTIEWQSLVQWQGPPLAGVEISPRRFSSPRREITALLGCKTRGACLPPAYSSTATKWSVQVCAKIGVNGFLKWDKVGPVEICMRRKSN